MKIYTKAGDHGETSLLGGSRVTKDCITLQTVGEIDELSSFLGIVISELDDKELIEFLLNIQRDLFKVGAELASLQTEIGKQMEKIGLPRVEILENKIDEFAKELPELKKFILPGGTKAGACLHEARAICRRAERALVSLGKEKPIRSELYMYLNRLSDFLFVVARWVNLKAKKEEIII